MGMFLVLSHCITLTAYLLICMVLHVTSGAIRCNVPEESRAHTIVCNLANKIGFDSAENAHFELIPNVFSHYFTLDTSRGVITTAKVIDREQIQHCILPESIDCQLEFFVTYQRNKDDRSAMQNYDLIIQIDDINDNYPKFPKNPVTVYMKEHMRNINLLLQRAKDPDAGRNGSIYYNFPQQLLHYSHYMKFMVEEDKIRGLSLKVIGDVDLQIDKSPIELTVQARDDAINPLVTNLTVFVVVENVNDYAPTFDHDSENPTVTILENVSQTHFIIKLNATDKDAHIERLHFQLVPGPHVAKFQIDEYSGEIRLRSNVDAEETRQYSFQVVVSDNHGPEPKSAFTTVTVNVDDVNDNKPEILIHPLVPKVGLAVKENLDNIMIAIIEVSDKDFDLKNSQVSCDTQSFNQQTIPTALSLDLTVDKDNGRFKRYMLKNTIYLDREKKSHYNLHLTCNDSGGAQSSRSFTVQVLDENDNKPVFATNKITLKFMENLKPNTVIGTIVATDADTEPNAKIVYEVLEPFRHFVNIGKSNGTLYSLVSFDREMNASFHLVVRAQDPDKDEMNSVVDVEIVIQDVNDCSPVFRPSNYTFRIPENRLTHDIGSVKAYDLDDGINGQVYYVMVKQSAARKQSTTVNVFKVNHEGKLYMVTPSIDRETTPFYDLEIEARDKGVPPRSAVTYVRIEVIDENDITPRFVFPSDSKHNNSLNVSLHEKANSVVARISAVDEDEGQNGHMRYSIEAAYSHGCEFGLFYLDEFSGDLKLAKNIPADYKVGTVCNLLLHVRDHGVPFKESRQSLRIEFTGSKPRVPDSSDRFAAAKSTRDLITITICIILSILVLFCVVVLLSYFCYYVQARRQPVGIQKHRRSEDEESSANNWLSRFCRNGDTNHPRPGWRENLGSSSTGATLQPRPNISKPLIAGDIAKFRPGDRYCLQSSPDSGRGTGLEGKFKDDVNFSNGLRESMMYARLEGTLPEDLAGHYQNTVNLIPEDYQMYPDRSQNNNMCVDSKTYYKSLKPPMTDPAKRKNVENGSDNEEESANDLSRVFQSVHYLVDNPDTIKSLKTAGAVLKDYPSGTTTHRSQRSGGYVYGSPYLTSSFV